MAWMLFSKRARISSVSFSGCGLARRDQRGGQQRLAQFLQQALQHLVVGHAQADGAARRVRHAARHLLGGVEDERERPRRGRLEHAVLAVVDARVVGELRQVAAQQREVVLVVDAAHAAQLLDGVLVVEVAHERVARVGGHRGEAAVVQDLRGLAQQADLRVVGMDVEELGHGRIVSARAASLARQRLFGQHVHRGRGRRRAGPAHVERRRRRAAGRDHGHADPGPVVGHVVEDEPARSAPRSAICT